MKSVNNTRKNILIISYIINYVYVSFSPYKNVENNNLIMVI